MRTNFRGNLDPLSSFSFVFLIAFIVSFIVFKKIYIYKKKEKKKRELVIG